MVDRAWTRIGRELAIAAFGVPLETIDASVVDRITEVFEEAYVLAGQVLWSAGGVVDTLWVMHDGRVRSTREGVSPWSYEGRWFLGDLEGHLDAPATRTLVATRDFHALKVRRRTWHGLLEDSFDLTKLAVTASAKAVAQLDARLGRDARPRARSLVKWSLERPLSAVERIAFLAELPTARTVGVQALADLATVAHEVWLDDGRVLFEPGDRRDHFFFVVAGKVEAVCTRPEVLRMAHAGDVVGGAAALSDALDCWCARARGPTRLLAMPFEAWFDLMEAHFDLAQSTLAVLGEEREGILEQLACGAGEDGLVLR